MSKAVELITMKPISLLDVIVYVLIVGVSILRRLRLSQIAGLVVSILVNLPWIVIEVLRQHDAQHYSNITNILQHSVIAILGYAFNEVDYQVGRLFFDASNLLMFLRWRGCPTKTFTVKHKHDVLVYQFGDKPSRVILYLHGGGLIVGSVPFYAEFLNLLQSKCDDTIILSPEYTLVPDATFPTQLDEVEAVYQYIVKTYPNAEIVLGSDSAGSLLCQSLLLRLTKHRIKSAFMISPWLDVDDKYHRDQGPGDYISPETASKYGRWYSSKKHNLASPLSWSDDHIKASVPLGGLYITCGGSETLRSDSEILAAITGATLHIEPNEIHAYVLINLYLRRGDRRFDQLDRIVQFIKSPS